MHQTGKVDDRKGPGIEEASSGCGYITQFSLQVLLKCRAKALEQGGGYGDGDPDGHQTKSIISNFEKALSTSPHKMNGEKIRIT